MSHRELRLYLTPPHPCSYLDGREATTLFADPAATFDGEIYQWLIDQGFRRSGEHIYRPHCTSCHDCIPLRIPVREWRPNRAQRRAWNRVAGALETFVLAPRFDPNHYCLYQRYLAARHPEGDMGDNGPEAYLRFLAADWCPTRFVEFRLQGQLLGVAVTDYLPRGLSAVYTFFDPALESVSPGVLCILWQIQQARALGLDSLYLGYWVPGCRKMAYKAQYRPFEALIDGEWRGVTTQSCVDDNS